MLLTLNSPISLGRKADLSVLLLRISMGLFMIIGHGWGKLLKVLNGDLGFADPIGLGMATSLYLTTFAEFICSVLLIIGFATRWALIPLMVAMAVATFISNGGEPFTSMEKSLMYLVIYLAIWITGPGKYSLDSSLSSPKA